MVRMKTVLCEYKTSSQALRTKCEAQEREILRLRQLLAKNNIEDVGVGQAEPE